eukprot:CAMPEP_0118904204 /NCGR_PEP_ID=MMETSP1166-20130328/8769_1 /TAXON_ID=1104430 /ORGANISM="Chrysoreinhardia sp, Strain CCMP3193" /LENGTH=145 /DNA_ID=CAMNT_0006843453 /DNA_START=87 /DNA_END=524 /DNA_ORIENTATION=-
MVDFGVVVAIGGGEMEARDEGVEDGDQGDAREDGQQGRGEDVEAEEGRQHGGPRSLAALGMRQGGDGGEDEDQRCPPAPLPADGDDEDAVLKGRFRRLEPRVVGEADAGDARDAALDGHLELPPLRQGIDLQLPLGEMRLPEVDA